MALDSAKPLDNVLLSELPKYIRETRSAINAQSENYITSIPLEFGVEDFDVVFLDADSNMFRRSKAGDETRNRVHGLYMADIGAVQIAGFIQNDAWAFVPGATVYVSANEYGDLTNLNTGLVAGIAITNDTIIVASTISEQIDAIMMEISDARLGFITVGQAMRDFSTKLTSNIAEVVAARGTKGTLNERILDLVSVDASNKAQLLEDIQALEKAIADAIRTYPSLLALMQAHETQFTATYNEVVDARGAELTLKARIESVVKLYDEVISARQGRLNLLANLVAMQDNHSTLLAEIVAARGAYGSLGDNMAALTNTQTEVVLARGVYSSLSAHLTGMEEATIALLGELTNARGLAATLAARLNVSINDDGTLKTTVTPTTWFTEQSAIAKVTATIFTVGGDKTAVYVPGRAVELNGNVYGYVLTCAYSSGTDLTTVSISGAGIASGLTNVAYSFHPNVLPQQNHSNLSNLQTADETSADTVKIKHVSNLQLKTLYDAKTNHEGRLVSAEGSISTLIADLDAAELVVANHASRLTAAEGTITSHGTRLTTAEGEIDALQTTSGSQDTAISALQTLTRAMFVGNKSVAVAKLANFTVAAGGVYRVQAAGLTISLLSGPVAMDWFMLIPEVDVQANPLVLNTTSQKFQGKSENLLIDTNRALLFYYTGATYGWTIIN